MSSSSGQIIDSDNLRLPCSGPSSQREKEEAGGGGGGPTLLSLPGCERKEPA